jgi:aminoglycoside phosphotransferase (APT) family kinase protein
VSDKMHPDGVDADPSVVRRLLATQFPQWATLPIEPVGSAGTDHTIYRLGEQLAVRLPRIHAATEQVAKEHRWLRRLAPDLPLAVPFPVEKRHPGEGYPWHWSVYRWIKGRDASAEVLADAEQAAAQLGSFVAALHRIDPTGGPPAGTHNSHRGEPLAKRDHRTRAAIATLRDARSSEAVTATWQSALAAPEWRGPGVWLHGDLQPANLLVSDGELRAVIDFGCLGVGDPACDVMAAWTFLPGAARGAFRAALGVDDATWARGRGWALSFGVIALPYYQGTNPVLAGIARRTIDEAVADHEGSP